MNTNSYTLNMDGAWTSVLHIAMTDLAVESR